MGVPNKLKMQKSDKNLVLKEDGLGVWDKQMPTLIYRMDEQ